jgi:hypothetical protein
MVVTGRIVTWRMSTTARVGPSHILLDNHTMRTQHVSILYWIFELLVYKINGHDGLDAALIPVMKNKPASFLANKLIVT